MLKIRKFNIRVKSKFFSLLNTGRSISQVIFLFFFLKIMLFPFFFSDIFPWERALVILNLQNFLHLNCKFSNFNKFLDIISYCNHLVIVYTNYSNLNSTSGHNSLKIFRHLFNAKRMNITVSYVNKYHLCLFIPKCYRNYLVIASTYVHHQCLVSFS